MRNSFIGKSPSPNVLLTVLLIASLFLMSACSKKGDTGPAGATGAQGPAGPTGPKGPGAVSGTFSLVNTDYKQDFWSISTGPGSSLGISARMALKNLPAITADVFNTGTVLVYLKTPGTFGGDNTSWSPLPYDIRGYDLGYLTSIKFNYEAGKLRVYYLIVQTDAVPTKTVPSVSTITIPSYDYKYVIIPGTAAVRASSGVDLSDYNAVAKYYNLKD